MQTLPPPPYKKRHLKTSSEFIAGLTPEKLTEWADLHLTPPEHNGDDWSPESVQRLADARDQAAEHLPAIRQRLDALRDALGSWCAPRGIEVQIKHLHGALSPYHLSRYLKDALTTLQEAEADLAIWQQMTEAQRDERWAQWTRDKIEARERRKKQAEIRAKKNAFYSAFFAMGLSPIPMGTEVRFAKESDRRLHELELEISNLGNSLYE